MSIYEQREGLWGDHLPIISLHFKIVGPSPARPSPGPPSPPAKCTSTPQRCSGHPSVTYCPSDPAKGQCDQPMPHPPCPPCPPPPPPPPSPGCRPPTCICPGVGPHKPCPHHTDRCCSGHNWTATVGLLPGEGSHTGGGGGGGGGTSAAAADDSTGRAAAAIGGWVEFTACPVADMKGNYYQDVFFRVAKYNATGEVVESRYFDTYAFRTTGSE